MVDATHPHCNFSTIVQTVISSPLIVFILQFRSQERAIKESSNHGGADTNPDWYHNLKAHPDAQVEVGDETVDVRPEEIKGPDRDRFYARQASLYPNFGEYQRKTKRVIPVIAFTPKRSKL